VWGGDSECEHRWEESKQSLVHENRQNLTCGTFDAMEREVFKKELHGFQESNAYICSKCTAWYGSLGLEPHPNMYVQHLVEISKELRRVLKKSGSYFLNLGDTYWGSNCGYGDKRYITDLLNKEKYKHYADLYNTTKKPQSKRANGWLKPKQKLLIPYRVAIALQADGWTCRNDLVWQKLNPLPSSVKDRLTCTTERIFHFVKSQKYFYSRQVKKQ